MSFYKKLDGCLEIVLSKVSNLPTYEMTTNNHTEFTYPVDGWYWFNTDAEAYAYFGLPDPSANIH